MIHFFLLYIFDIWQLSSYILYIWYFLKFKESLPVRMIFPSFPFLYLDIICIQSHCEWKFFWCYFDSYAFCLCNVTIFIEFLKLVLANISFIWQMTWLFYLLTAAKIQSSWTTWKWNRRIRRCTFASFLCQDSVESSFWLNLLWVSRSIPSV